MGDHPGPLAADLDAARDRGLLADPEQLQLLQDQVPGRDAATAVQVARRGPGRPAGALNKQNRKFRDQILAICGGQHPAVGLARASTTPVDLLAAQLGCSLYEAATLSLRAAADLMPYLERKQPVEIDLREHSDMILVIAGGGVSGDQLAGIRDEIDAVEGVDWSTCEIEDVVPSIASDQGGLASDVQSGSCD